MAVEDNNNSNTVNISEERIDSSWNVTTNWEIVAGSLANSVTFETPLSLNDDEESSANSSSSSPLVLLPPSPDAPSCEITITLDAKHEIRQVYIRSTARVYEMYYAPDLQSNNEYLCTVRCGVAVRDDEVLHTNAIPEVTAGQPSVSSKHKYKNGTKWGSSEEDWVEVKAPGTPISDYRDVSLVPKSDTGPGGSTQDYYEATAELDDINPCRSITLRLLSLQNKSCLYVDEVYVFGDPVNAAEAENHTGPADNSTGSSFMAMLMPTLLQLSKSSGIGRVQEKDTFDSRGNGKYLQTELSNAVSTIQEEKAKITSDHQLKSQGVNEAAVLPAQEATPCDLDLERNPGVPPRGGVERAKENNSDCHSCGHVERVLDQLVPRVSKIEDIFLRFEENMVKPIINIEARLERVEQILEELSKIPHKSEFPSCSRIYAPEFSCFDFTNPPYYGGTENVTSKPHKGESSVPCDNPCISANATQLHPSLRVTAPEFPNGDDEEGTIFFPADSPEPISRQDLSINEEANKVNGEKDLQTEKPKQRVSVDDALASAFARFLESTSTDCRDYVQTLAVTAPDFPSEEGPNEKEASRPAYFDESIGSELKEDSNSTSGDVFSVGNEESLTGSFGCKYSGGASEKDEQCLHHEGQEGCDLQGRDFDDMPAPAKHSSYSEFSQKSEESESLNCDEFCSNLVAETECLNNVVQSQIHIAVQEGTLASTETTFATEAGTQESNLDIEEGAVANTVSSVATGVTLEGSQHDGQEGADPSTELTVSTGVITTGFNHEALQDVLRLTRASSILDFESPVLDVKFTSQVNQEAKSSTEALLGDLNGKGVGMKEDAREVSCGREYNDDISTRSTSNLIAMDDAELAESASYAHFSVDMDYCKLIEGPSKLEDENLQGINTPSDQEMPAASLI